MSGPIGVLNASVRLDLTGADFVRCEPRDHTHVRASGIRERKRNSHPLVHCALVYNVVFTRVLVVPVARFQRERAALAEVLLHHPVEGEAQEIAVIAWTALPLHHSTHSEHVLLSPVGSRVVIEVLRLPEVEGQTAGATRLTYLLSGMKIHHRKVVLHMTIGDETPNRGASIAGTDVERILFDRDGEVPGVAEERTVHVVAIVGGDVLADPDL